MSQFEKEIKGLVQLASGTCSLSTNVNEAFIQSGCQLSPGCVHIEWREWEISYWKHD